MCKMTKRAVYMSTPQSPPGRSALAGKHQGCKHHTLSDQSQIRPAFYGRTENNLSVPEITALSTSPSPKPRVLCPLPSSYSECSWLRGMVIVFPEPLWPHKGLRSWDCGPSHWSRATLDKSHPLSSSCGVSPLTIPWLVVKRELTSPVTPLCLPWAAGILGKALQRERQADAQGQWKLCSRPRELAHLWPRPRLPPWPRPQLLSYS